MSTGWIVFIIVTVVLIGLLIGLSIFGKKLQKKQEESDTQMRAGAQLASIIVIEKKRQKMKDAGFPSIVLESTPKYLRASKVPTIKAKVGPRVVTLIADEKAFNLIPEKREVKVLINGIYIVEAKSARGGLLAPPVKKTFRQKLAAKAEEMKKKTSAGDTTAKKSKK